jgi:hypothetical protein
MNIYVVQSYLQGPSCTKSYKEVGVRDKSTKRKHSLANFISANTDKLGLQTVIFFSRNSEDILWKLLNHKTLFYTYLFLAYSQKLIQIFLLQCYFLVKFISVTTFFDKNAALHQWITPDYFLYQLHNLNDFFLPQNSYSTMTNVSALQPSPMMLRKRGVFFFLFQKWKRHTHTHTKQIINQLVFSDTCRAFIDISRKFFVRMHSTEWNL